MYEVHLTKLAVTTSKVENRGQRPTLLTVLLKVALFFNQTFLIYIFKKTLH